MGRLIARVKLSPIFIPSWTFLMLKSRHVIALVCFDFGSSLELEIIASVAKSSGISCVDLHPRILASDAANDDKTLILV